MEKKLVGFAVIRCELKKLVAFCALKMDKEKSGYNYSKKFFAIHSSFSQ